MKQKIKRFIKDHIWGPTGSVILHILVVIVLVKFVEFTVREHDAEVEVMMMDVQAVDLDELKELEKELQELEPPEVDIDIDMTAEVPNPEDVEPVDTTEPEVDLAALDIDTQVTSPLILRGLYQGRTSGGRDGALRAFGAPIGVESSVLKALEWLRKNQQPDGSWKSMKTAMTGLALLTFLAHGETVSSEKYGETVEKAIKYLISQLNDKGRFGNADSHYSYTHGVAAYALSEAYAMTRIPMLKPAMEKAIKGIVEGQQKGGGWDYNYKKEARRDTSVSAWQAQALKAAYLAEAEVPGIKQAMDKCIRDMKSIQVEDGRFGYTSKSGGTHSTTGGGALALQLLGHGEDQSVTSAINFLKTKECDFNNPDTNNALYAWYYMTQAMFHHGKGAWSTWNRKFATALMGAQEPDGHWEIPKGNKKQHNHGPVFNTTLAALTLQVYYRHLPTFKESAVKIEEVEEDMTDEDDVVIDLI